MAVINIHCIPKQTMMGMFLHFLLVLLTSMLFVQAQDQSGFISIDFDLPGNSSYTEKTTGIYIRAQDQSGFISIDCGLPGNSSYTEKTTGINYISDAKFIDVGVSKRISESENITHQQLGYVRSFPSGVRNCYKINVTSGTKYLIRATFYYGNYDNLNELPQFDLYLGANLWVTIKFSNTSDIIFSEIIYTPSLDYIQPCLVDTNTGTPFISSIELRNLSSKAYFTDTASVITLLARIDLGSITNLNYRYKDDAYDRIWFPGRQLKNWTSLSTSLNPKDLIQNDYKPPAIVMSTASTPVNASAPMNFSWRSIDVNDEYHIYMHFTEVEKLTPNETRAFNITMNDEFWYGPCVPTYHKTNTIFSKQALTGARRYNFSLFMTENSTLPPILNALEIYKVIDFSQSETEQDDVDAITNIKNAYGVARNWQGDPCVPVAFMWEGLNCSIDGNNPPNIISLNLSSSGLTGQIASSISNLTMLKYLDLSNNGFSGPIPDFLAQMLSLKVLNLGKNYLTGLVPNGLLERSKGGSLSLSVADNPDLCMTDSCKKKRFVVPLVASLSALIVILLISLGLWMFRRQKGSQPQIITIGEHKQMKLDELPLFDFDKLEAATKNFHFDNMLGKGGFGPVYKGILEDGLEIAVKRLSKASGQGMEEFMNEVVVISKLQHRNLVRIIGCCIQRNEQMLVYEFMPNKSLDTFLFDPLQKKALDWKMRFNIIEGIARGILYLHRDSRLRIIHRDIKASNILLDDKMTPKISDFGLARIFKDEENGEASTRRVVGTYGYMSPEYAMEGIFSEKSDVYSFGVLLLEIVSGQRNTTSFYNNEESLSLVGCAWKLWIEENIISLIDLEIWDPCFESSMLSCIHIGLLCVQEIPRERPTMSTVVSMLISEITNLPSPKKIAFVHKHNFQSAGGSSQKSHSNSNNNVTMSEIQGR